jgi:hypothetical protein
LAWRGFEGCLGDVVEIELDIVSSLPARLDVTHLTLVLSIMQVREPCCTIGKDQSLPVGTPDQLCVSEVVIPRWYLQGCQNNEAEKKQDDRADFGSPN